MINDPDHGVWPCQGQSICAWPKESSHTWAVAVWADHLEEVLDFGVLLQILKNISMASNSLWESAGPTSIGNAALHIARPDDLART